MESRIYNVNLQSGYNTLTYIGISQYDAGVPLQFNVYDGATAASFPVGTTAKIQGVRPSGVGFNESCTLTDNVVTVDTVTDMTGEAGKFPVEIRFESSGVDVGTVNFVMAIEKAPHPDGTIDADITRQETFIERLEAVEDDKVPYPVTDKYGTVGQVLKTLGDGTTEWANASSGQGVSDALKVALLQIAQKVVYIDEHGQDYYDALESALYPPANLVSISAVYTQSGTVYNTDTLDSLKSDLVVTAHYDNSTSAVVTTYTLSGTLTVGTSVITVAYGGKTTTFNVTVTRYDTSVYSWDFTQSLIDTKQSATAVLANATRSSAGVTFDTNDGYIYLADLSSYGSTQYTVEIDFGAFTNTSGKWPINLNTGNASPGSNGLRYNEGFWSYYLTNNSGYYPSQDEQVTDASVFANKTLKFQCDYTNKTWTTYADSTKIIETTAAYKNSNNRNHLFVGKLPAGTVVKAVRIYEGIE